MTLMTGSPPRAEDQVHLGNWRQAPACRWAFNHVREILPTASISACRGQSRPLHTDLRDLSSIVFRHAGGESMAASDWVRRDAVDSVVITRGDQTIFEWFAPGQSAQVPHILMSVSKSVLGLLAGAVFSRTGTDPNTLVTAVIPELKGSAWDGATLRHALDMQVGIAFEENYLAIDGAIIAYRKAQGWNPLGPGEAPGDLRSFFPTLTGDGDSHGERFHYVSPNTDMMAWALERIGGKRYHELLSELLWQPLGAEEDAYITVDRLGAPRAAGGVCTTAHDLARLGLLVAEEGTWAGREVLPAEWVSDTLGGGSRAAFEQGDFSDKLPGEPVSYRNYCYWNACERPYMFGVGIHGQAWIIDPKEAIVVVVQSSHGDPQPNGAIANAIAVFKSAREQLD